MRTSGHSVSEAGR